MVFGQTLLPWVPDIISKVQSPLTGTIKQWLIAFFIHLASYKLPEILTGMSWFRTALDKKQWFRQETLAFIDLIVGVVVPEVLTQMMSLDMRIAYDLALEYLTTPWVQRYGRLVNGFHDETVNLEADIGKIPMLQAIEEHNDIYLQRAC